ncbi:MAG: hypothetical protein ACR2NP_00255 [Pirellulaceae bacterium]
MNPVNKNFGFASWGFCWLIALALAMPATAQISEMQITRYVPADTVLGLTVNIESIREHVDLESESVQFLIESAREVAIDLMSLNRIVMCAGYDYEPGRWDMFGREESTVNQFEFAEPIDLDKYIAANSWGRTFTEQQAGDFTLHVGAWQVRQDQGVSAGAMCLTDEGRRLFIGDDERIRKALDAPSDSGVMLVNQMDVEADLAVEFDLSELDSEARDRVFGWFGELHAGMGLDLDDWKESLESGTIVIDFDQDRAGYAVLRFDDEAVAREAHALLKQGIAAMPFLISMMETELEKLEQDGDEGDGIEVRPSLIGRLIPNLKKAVASSSVVLDGTNVEVTVQAEGGFPELPGLAVQTLYAESQVSVEGQRVEAGFSEAVEDVEAAQDTDDDREKKSDDDG